MTRSLYERLRRIGVLFDEQLIRYDVLFYGIAIAALWYLFRPYTGIIHDSTIYIGRALADLHPSSIGQQMSYAYDGQSQFSVAPRLFKFLVAEFGPNKTAIGLTVIGLALWIVAATVLLSRFLGKRLLFAALLCLCAMPSAYGGNWVFHWAEPFATPRLFAEAASLTAIAMFVEQRFVLSFVCCLAASVLHPIMALPAIGLVFVLLCEADIRWLWAAVAAFALLLFGVIASVPVIDRLFVFPDPAWLAIMSDESKQVILADWYAATWSLTACQFVTVGLAFYLTEGIVRRFAGAAFIVAISCMAISLAWPSLLILQVQIWRALWLLSFFAVGLLPLVVVQLWKKGRLGQASVALLLAAWLLYAQPVGAAPALVAAVGLALARIDRPIPRWTMWICWGLAFAACEFFLSTTVPQAVGFYRLLPDGIYGFSPDSVGFGFQFPILVGLAVAIALGWAPRFNAKIRLSILLGAMILAAIAVTHWDRRSKFVLDLDEGVGASSLASQIPSGNVFWLTGYVGNIANPSDDWLWTSRPSWWDGEQGAGVVFNRSLALESNRRVELLRKAGLLDKVGGGNGAHKTSPPLITGAVLDRLCVGGGPNWIVAPLKLTDAQARSHAAGVWRAPAPTYLWDISLKRMVRLQTYSIFNCNPSHTQTHDADAKKL